MKFLLKWWWPSYALVCPLLFLPGNELGFASEFSFRFLVNIVAIVGGIFLEMDGHPTAKLTDVKLIPNWLKSNPVIYFTIFYGIWVFIASFFTKNPSLALTGSTEFYTLLPIGYGSSLWEISLCLVFILVYVRSKNQDNLKFLVIRSILIFCSLISLIAVIEVLTRSSILTGANNADGQLPYVTFLGRGHLAGFLCIGFGLLLYMLKANLNYQWLGYLVCIAIGATQNRSSLIAVFLVLCVILLQKLKQKFAIVGLSILFLGSGFFLSQELLWKDKTIVFRTQGDLTSGRSLLWKSALNGILASPVFGWGGIDYAAHWGNFLTKNELVAYFKMADFGGDYRSHSNSLYILKNKEGDLVFKSFDIWYAHNDFLDRSLNYGLVGYILYFIILIYSVKNGWSDKSVIGIIAYQIFLLTWFPADASHGTYWSLLAVVCASQKALPNEMSAAEKQRS